MNATFEESGDQDARGEPTALSFARTARTANVATAADSIRMWRNKCCLGRGFIVRAAELRLVAAS